jgi:DNA-binding HxlR family transcriptional regulator
MGRAALDVRNVFFADCAARSIFDQVANKWSVMILILVKEKPTRFNEIRGRLKGVTHKALAQALRRLERDGLIAREALATSPVAVEYSITELGAPCKSRSERRMIGLPTVCTRSSRRKRPMIK